MKRIHRLHLRHFKAFTDQIFDFEGKHALIFGPNGSGKSSIFAALQTVLQSAVKSVMETERLLVKPPAPISVGEPEDYANDYAYQSAIETEEKRHMAAQNLRNIYTTSGEAATIRIDWFDDAAQLGEIRYLTEGRVETAAEPAIQEAFLASEFIGFRLMQAFAPTSRQAINVWATFVRDLFPYYQPLGASLTFTATIDDLVSRLPRMKNGYTFPQSSRRYKAWEAEFGILNGHITLFVEQVVNGANDFLAKLFGNEVTQLQIGLKYARTLYPGQFTYGVYGRGTWDGFTSDERQQQMMLENFSSKIEMTINLINSALPGGLFTSDRPQNILNEARLTRIALALRLGALQSRPAAAVSDFRVLCLDDLLISLDMENRRHVLDWLFDPGIHDTYQIFFLTHDRDLHRMLSHYIQTRQPGAWKYHEVYMDESQSPPTPYVPPHQTTNHAEAARRSFHRHEFAACANELRRACEKAILEFLPERYRLRLDKNGLPETLTLEKLIDALAKLFKEYAQNFAPYRDLKLYKDLHLNPLSHHYETPVVMQHELRHFMDKVLPPLLNLRAELEIERHPLVATFVDMPLTGRNGAVTTYRLRLFEPLHRLHFDATTVRRSNPKCQVVGMLPIQADGLPTPPPSAWLDKETTLHYVYGQLLRALGVIAADKPALEAVHLQRV